MKTSDWFLALVQTTMPKPYALNASFEGRDFLTAFNWETIDDPTHGRVNYVNKDMALQNNLTFASGNKFVMRADDRNVVLSQARGRDSIRITSYAAYEDSLLILDVSHMPEGCSTWPAWWTLSQQGPWPQGGEIDIIEGVNIAATDQVSLHTTPGCTIPQPFVPSSNILSTNCDASVNGNQGCGISLDYGTYGRPFNQANGGYYAMRRDKHDGISVWFLNRDLFSSPYVLDPSLLQTIRPNAHFPMGSNCDYAQHFNAHQIIFDLTFCGDWAGSVWSTSSCASAAPTCESFVDNNPSAFQDAYWEINSLRVYLPGDFP
ncbi:concanavalin A-like lectin/glucanase domain-containing protein [Hygrophoropsis aurantiaca]|uniref:Concanavalin A-like lectin/glucanase domain-containing protein n=1 Tax=Hygrophoropsis aurantiaca TaxID=72124 RepID=A0ACB8ABK1_9AGAM|nr:concanavalin A-like lectin/glucanase domain-containing protein [Hygrophoropsis aurantiaca]